MPKKRPCFYRGVLAVLAACLLVLLIQVIPSHAETQEDKVDPAVCMDCHDDMAQSLKGTVHDLKVEGKSSPGVSCISCHSGWEAHLEDPNTENINSGKELVLQDQALICAGCHSTPHQESMLNRNPHGIAGVACLDCHSIHTETAEGGEHAGLTPQCLSCHQTVEMEFKRRTSHPLESGNIQCVDCHSMGDTKDHMFAVGLDWTCQGCHSEVSGPFLFEHAAANEHFVEGGGCVECHSPHGSPHERLLNQPGAGLCLQCHGTPPTHKIAHDGIATQFVCVDCHSDIHGSNDNRKLLDPMLGSKMSRDCFQCHVLGD